MFEAAKWLTEHDALYQQESIKLNPNWNDLFTGRKGNDICTDDTACSSSSSLTEMNVPADSINSECHCSIIVKKC